MSVVAQVQKLIGPLGDDAERILNECDDDQEASNGWEVTVFRDPVLAQACSAINRESRNSTHGFKGSLTESRRSSILLVKGRTWSRTLPPC